MSKLNDSYYPDKETRAKYDSLMKTFYREINSTYYKRKFLSGRLFALFKSLSVTLVIWFVLIYFTVIILNFVYGPADSRSKGILLANTFILISSLCFILFTSRRKKVKQKQLTYLKTLENIENLTKKNLIDLRLLEVYLTNKVRTNFKFGTTLLNKSFTATLLITIIPLIFQGVYLIYTNEKILNFTPYVLLTIEIFIMVMVICLSIYSENFYSYQFRLFPTYLIPKVWVQKKLTETLFSCDEYKKLKSGLPSKFYKFSPEMNNTNFELNLMNQFILEKEQKNKLIEKLKTKQ